ncbi:glutamyl-tRNA amidotransferase [Pseudomonas sp. BN414]|uniref:amidase family protein n=1 Tax=Pseudomonas sp. BN414 TaxID=2567888 RepID=UPI0024538CCB|nr:amidase family protein [Pseudomonas sp. BN414]MDH4566886.1 glutamyl-tRNA amidotransferase [Pseudomonas sp. BN414]
MVTLADTSIALARGEVTSVELVRVALERAKSSTHVFTELFVDEALEQAVASDARRACGQQLSPLDGIPLAIKDLFDICGSKTLAGSLTRLDVAPANSDAAVVAALRAKGMIALGKTNLSELAFSGLGLNPHFGTPTPDFPGLGRRAPGGSSAGSAVAVQRGIVTAALGSDTGGSIRVPAAFNGLVGFKSSPERYAMAGVHPLAHSLDSLGPIAQSVRDCVLIDAAMRGLPEPTLKASTLTQVRFVVDTGILADRGLQPSVRDNLLRVMACLERRGAVVEQRHLNTLEEVRQLIPRDGWLGAIEGWALLKDVVQGERGASIDRRVSSRLRSAGDIPEARVASIRAARQRLIHAISEELGDAILVMPTVRHVAPPLAPLEEDDSLFAATNMATLSLTMIGSFLNMPGLAVPSGRDPQGLPTSVLFSALHGDDDKVLCAGLAVEEALAARPD